MNRAGCQTIRELIEAQRRRIRSSNSTGRTLQAFLHCGSLGSRLRLLTDRQIGQLAFDVVLDELGLVSPAMLVCVEASERLFRSPAGARTTERFNELDNLPECPRCGQPMIHHIGLDEPDYRQCVSLKCGHKVKERND